MKVHTQMRARWSLCDSDQGARATVSGSMITPIVCVCVCVCVGQYGIQVYKRRAVVALFHVELELFPKVMFVILLTSAGCGNGGHILQHI